MIYYLLQQRLKEFEPHQVCLQGIVGNVEEPADR